MQRSDRARNGVIRAALAVVLAYALALQLLIPGLIGGSQGASHLRGPICAPGSDVGLRSGGDAPPVAPRAGDDPCCLAGCNPAPTATAGSDRPALPTRAHAVSAANLATAAGVAFVGRPLVLPLGARAPPVLA